MGLLLPIIDLPNLGMCDCLPDAYIQKIGTAMGTSFSVTYATIFMIWLETPIIEEFRAQILLYKRFLDDIFMIWSGSSAELFRLQVKFESVNNPAIKSVMTLEWQGMLPHGARLHSGSDKLQDKLAKY